jgi:hypothetical protein
MMMMMVVDEIVTMIMMMMVVDEIVVMIMMTMMRYSCLCGRWDARAHDMDDEILVLVW